MIELWVDEVGTPSVGFGPSHSHFTADGEGIIQSLEFCRAVMRDQLLIMQDVGGQHDGHMGWLDLREPDALEEEITSPYSPGRARLLSWSGAADRDVGPEAR